MSEIMRSRMPVRRAFRRFLSHAVAVAALLSPSAVNALPAEP